MPEETRTIGYICPVCGQAVIVRRTAFQLAAGNSVLPCPCGRSELSFAQMGDRCEVTVPCLFCAKDHTAVCSNEAMLGRELLALSEGWRPWRSYAAMSLWNWLEKKENEV